jgi:hypothetical protein
MITRWDFELGLGFIGIWGWDLGFSKDAPTCIFARNGIALLVLTGRAGGFRQLH